MNKLNSAASKIMNSGFTRGQSRQMILKVVKDNRCSVDVALYAIMEVLDEIKKVGLKGRIDDEKLKADMIVN